MATWGVIKESDADAQRGLRLIGASVRAGRWNWGMSQRQLAWRALVSQSTISKLETGKLQGMRLGTLARIVGILRVGVTNDDPNPPPPPSRRLPRRHVSRLDLDGAPTVWDRQTDRTDPSPSNDSDGHRSEEH
jgi:transcriptional regulator with XRE-family HTH domain